MVLRIIGLARRRFLVRLLIAAGVVARILRAGIVIVVAMLVAPFLRGRVAIGGSVDGQVLGAVRILGILVAAGLFGAQDLGVKGELSGLSTILSSWFEGSGFSAAKSSGSSASWDRGAS